MAVRRDIFQAIADPTRWAIITLITVQAMVSILELNSPEPGNFLEI